MRKFEMTDKEAEADIDDARVELVELIMDGQSPMDYCEDRWGLEPDYLDELLMMML